jgi:arsenate reductase
MDRKEIRTEKAVTKVLFLCYGNACRSIMAEALARHFLGNRIEARSAGLVPLGYIPSPTLGVLGEAGIPADGLHSKGLAEVRLDDIDFLVNLSGLRVESSIPPSFSGKLISYHVRDPFGFDIQTYREVRTELESLVKIKLPELITAQKEGCG